MALEQQANGIDENSRKEPSTYGNSTWKLQLQKAMGMTDFLADDTGKLAHHIGKNKVTFCYSKIPTFCHIKIVLYCVKVDFILIS